MSNPIKALYIHSVCAGSAPKKVRAKWCKLMDKIRLYVPDDKSEDIIEALDGYHAAVEYHGFVTGFKVAWELCRRCEK